MSIVNFCCINTKNGGFLFTNHTYNMHLKKEFMCINMHDSSSKHATYASAYLPKSTYNTLYIINTLY